MARRNILYGLIVIFAAAAVVFAVQLYREKQKPEGVEISIGERGISIEKKERRTGFTAQPDNADKVKVPQCHLEQVSSSS